MAANPVRFGILLLPALLVGIPASSAAQLVPGQYEDEAPLRSWNTFGLAGAASLGRGETQLALAEDCSAALGNPALLSGLPQFSACLNGTYSYNSLFRYSIVNTGVLVTDKNPAIGLFSLDFAGISCGYKGWTVALAVALAESYDRPGVAARSYFEGRPYLAISFAQAGYLRNVNLAAARRINRKIQVGLGLNFVRGELNREVIDQDFAADVTINHSVNQQFSGFFLNAGLLAKITGRLDLAVVARTAYDKKAESRSLLRYLAPQGGTDIRIKAASNDRYRQPWAAGLGICYAISAEFRVLADLIYFPWSRYRAEVFQENERRDFLNTYKASAGVDYCLGVRLFGHDTRIPLRLGISHDRQPIRKPGSAYTNVSLGTGIRWRMIRLDIGAQFGRESGSGHSLEILRAASSLGIHF